MMTREKLDELHARMLNHGTITLCGDGRAVAVVVLTARELGELLAIAAKALETRR
jgi:hypothetical protein